jgi:hypothetical protein
MEALHVHVRILDRFARRNEVAPRSTPPLLRQHLGGAGQVSNERSDPIDSTSLDAFPFLARDPGLPEDA